MYLIGGEELDVLPEFGRSRGGPVTADAELGEILGSGGNGRGHGRLSAKNSAPTKQ